MWKKDDEQAAQPTVGSTQRVASPRPPSSQTSAKATIGPSITIDGDVTGSEDLLIQGEITGSVTLDDHAVGVGTEGRVKADIVGRLITVEGHVEGDLTAQEQIVLRGTAHVKGDIKAPRVVLEDGATFRGLVDMGAAPADRSDKRASSGSKAESSSRSTGSSADAGEPGKDGKDGAAASTSSSDGNGKTASASSKGAGKGTGDGGTSKSSGSGRPSANA